MQAAAGRRTGSSVRGRYPVTYVDDDDYFDVDNFELDEVLRANRNAEIHAREGNGTKDLPLVIHLIYTPRLGEAPISVRLRVVEVRNEASLARPAVAL
eukprot:6695200-Alexandrium_andersonii.AAC.1